MFSEDEARAAAQIAAEKYDADIYFYSAEINDEGLGSLFLGISEYKKRRNALLILITNGGSANSAYQIARIFQKTYSSGTFSIFIPSYCKSAGTLIALGAHLLIMDEVSELGPLDVQLYRRDELGTRRSGLLSRSSFEALQEVSLDLFEHLMLNIKRRSGDLISFKLAAKISTRLSSGMMTGIYSQINPEVLGDDYRDLQVAYHYGVRLVSVSKNASDATVRHLVEHYPSHDFIIDNDEASQLFNRVESPSDELYDLLKALGDPAYNEHKSGIVLALSAFTEGTGDGENEDEGREDAHEPAEDTAGDQAGAANGVDADREDDRQRGEAEG